MPEGDPLASTAPHGGDEAMSVVVGVDGSPESLAALQWAADYARRAGTRLRAVIAWEPSAGFGFMPVSRGSFEDEARHTLERAVHKVLGEPGEGVALEVVEGPARDVLLAASRSASLLVVGDREYSGVAGLLAGHTGEACARHAPCSVVVVRNRR